MREEIIRIRTGNEHMYVRVQTPMQHNVHIIGMIGIALALAFAIGAMIAVAMNIDRALDVLGAAANV